jgi:hypothetical protein
MAMTERSRSDLFIVVFVAALLLTAVAVTLALRPRETGSNAPAVPKNFDEQTQNNAARMFDEGKR